VETSEEIRRVVERWVRAASAVDPDTVVALLSDAPGSLHIGTDQAEWWRGRDTAELFRRQLQELEAGIPYRGIDVEAWEEGTVGWAAGKLTIAGVDADFEARMSAVLHLEHGEWKVVHSHLSVPVPNEDVFGKSVTVTIEQLRAVVESERPDISKSVAADGTITIMFTDIVDSTVLTARIGDSNWRDILHRHNRVIGDATAAHAGRVVKTLGDGEMLAFSSARAAVRCARDIQRALRREFLDESLPIRVRIGGHTGDALRDGDDFSGTTVNFAARIAEQALGGEILVSQPMRDLVAHAEPSIVFGDGRDVQLKGLDGRHRLFVVPWDGVA
jgi:class 3 adenylate cyclase/ketosteroid isomerase-like protein